MLFIPSACANQVAVPSAPSPTPKPAASTETEVTDSLITGKDWNNMTLSLKRVWVDTALRAMIIGGELKESEEQTTDYYVQKLDTVFYNPDNEKKLVAWELTAFTSTQSPPSNETTDTVADSAQFRISNLRLTPVPNEEREYGYITVDIENIGQKPGQYTFILKIDGKEVVTKHYDAEGKVEEIPSESSTKILAAGEKITAKLWQVKWDDKEHRISIDDFSETITLTNPLPAQTPSSIPTSPPTRSFADSVDQYNIIDARLLISNPSEYKDQRVRLAGRIAVKESHPNNDWWIGYNALVAEDSIAGNAVAYFRGNIADLSIGQNAFFYGVIAGTEQVRRSDGVLVSAPAIFTEFIEYWVSGKGLIVVSLDGGRQVTIPPLTALSPPKGTVFDTIGQEIRLEWSGPELTGDLYYNYKVIKGLSILAMGTTQKNYLTIAMRDNRYTDSCAWSVSIYRSIYQASIPLVRGACGSTFAMEATPPPTVYYLNVQVEPYLPGRPAPGSVIIDPPNPQCEAGITRLIRAVAQTGYVFDHWEEDATGTDDTITVLMDSEKYIVAIFKPLIPLSVTFDGWYVNGVRVDTAQKGDSIEGRIMLTGGVPGRYKLCSYRDLGGGNKEAVYGYTCQDFTYDGSSATVIKGFIASKASGEAGTVGYYLCLGRYDSLVDELPDDKVVWTMPNAYPPRITVTP